MANSKLEVLTAAQLARSYASLFPSERLPLTEDTFRIFGNWLERARTKPDRAIATANWCGKVTKAAFAALSIKQPKTKRDMVAIIGC